MTETILQTAKRGDLPKVRRRLEERVKRFGRGRERMSESEKLLDEALTFARMGDLDEVVLLLERRAHPKWSSHVECEMAYQSAMAEKSAREEVA
jgi:hypothetical protein